MLLQLQRSGDKYGENEDLIPMPPWMLLLSSPMGRLKVISIPVDIEIENLNISPNVEHVRILCPYTLTNFVEHL